LAWIVAPKSLALKHDRESLAAVTFVVGHVFRGHEIRSPSGIPSTPSFKNCWAYDRRRDYFCNSRVVNLSGDLRDLAEAFIGWLMTP
jgi:hypothetical protein